MPVRIPTNIQYAVDNYLELYGKYKQLETDLKELRSIIEPYMKENELRQLEDTTGQGRVELTLQQRSPMSARYTTYDFTEVAPLLSPALRKKCTAEVIDREKLEALSKLGEVSEDILRHKQTSESYTFGVRLKK